MMTKLWQPTKASVEQTNLYQYRQWLDRTHGLEFDDYFELWDWSVTEIEVFWKSLFRYFDISYSGQLDPVLIGEMPRASWFNNAMLNYAERIWEHADDHSAAIIWKTELNPLTSLTWVKIRTKVIDVQQYLLACGLKPGDRVAAFMPNIPETSIAFLATIGLGGVWSSCSPDFGAESVIDRFEQIEPTVLIATDGYTYNGKPYDKRHVVTEIFNRLDKTKHLLQIPFLGEAILPHAQNWSELKNQTAELINLRLPFNHPIWVLYSSGTTGAPKAITHSHGGVLLEHLKYITFHNDVKKGERFFWYSTTGWMMWNFVHASWLVGATVVLYDGSAAYPDLNAMWELSEEGKVNHFGTSAPYIVACMKADLSPGNDFDLSHLRSIGSTGSPLPPEGFDWVYTHVKKDLWLASMSGGTDVCTAFVGGCPTQPVYIGEIQCRALGCALYSWDDDMHHEENRVGEMVITKPMPSMPIYFWNDANFDRYTSSYFDMYPGVWRHGDWVEITDRGSLIIYGRSDATLNRHGIRIGTSEIYRALMDIQEIKDALIVNVELSGGRHYMPLFVILNENRVLSEELKKKINNHLRKTYTPRHVPDEIIAVPDIPYTISGKKMEAPVKKILMGLSSAASMNKGAMRNPESINFFENFARTMER
jgi:acetoacetyl-CoA synthetase